MFNEKTTAVVFPNSDKNIFEKKYHKLSLMKNTIRLILIMMLLLSLSACFETEDDTYEEESEQIDVRLGKFSGTGDLIYYKINGDIEQNYQDITVNVTVSNHWNFDYLYSVSINYPGKGLLNLKIKKSDFTFNKEDYTGSIVLSSSKCSGNAKKNNETTGKTSVSYSWNCSK